MASHTRVGRGREAAVTSELAVLSDRCPQLGPVAFGPVRSFAAAATLWQDKPAAGVAGGHGEGSSPDAAPDQQLRRPARKAGRARPAAPPVPLDPREARLRPVRGLRTGRRTGTVTKSPAATSRSCGSATASTSSRCSRRSKSPAAQQVIADFCRLINFPYQQQQGLFAVGYYTAVLPDLSARQRAAATAEPFGGAAAAAAGAAPFGTSFRPAEEAPAEEAPVDEIAGRRGSVHRGSHRDCGRSCGRTGRRTGRRERPGDGGSAGGSSRRAITGRPRLWTSARAEATEAIDEQWAEEEPVVAPPPAPVPAARPAPAAVPAPARADGRDRTPVVPPAPPPGRALARGLERRLHRPAGDCRPGPRTAGATGDSAGGEADHACRSRAGTALRSRPSRRSSGHSEPGRRASRRCCPMRSRLPTISSSPSAVAPQADASFGLDFIDEQDEQFDAQVRGRGGAAAPEAREVPQAPVISERRGQSRRRRRLLLPWRPSPRPCPRRCRLQPPVRSFCPGTSRWPRLPPQNRSRSSDRLSPN